MQYNNPVGPNFSVRFNTRRTVSDISAIFGRHFEILVAIWNFGNFTKSLDFGIYCCNFFGSNFIDFSLRSTVLEIPNYYFFLTAIFFLIWRYFGIRICSYNAIGLISAHFSIRRPVSNISTILFFVGHFGILRAI